MNDTLHDIAESSFKEQQRMTRKEWVERDPA